ncbi:hypothetical protein Dimus_012763 [Dionaea muscipula]
MAATSSSFFSPSSEKRFWITTLQSRVDDIRENRKHLHSSSSTEPWEGGLDGTKRFKEDSMLLRRGFDSVAFCLSQFSSNIDHALQVWITLALDLISLSEILDLSILFSA